MSLFRHDLPRARHLVTPAWLARLATGRSVEAAPLNDWCLFEVGCKGYFAMIRACAPHMCRQGSGWIVNTSSGSGFGHPGSGTKLGL